MQSPSGFNPTLAWEGRQRDRSQWLQSRKIVDLI